MFSPVLLLFPATLFNWQPTTSGRIWLLSRAAPSLTTLMQFLLTYVNRKGRKFNFRTREVHRLIKQITTIFPALFNLQGYTKPREYIVTEWPLHKTLGEFWSLVYDHECSAVVVICNPPPNSVSGVFINELSCFTFWFYKVHLFVFLVVYIYSSRIEWSGLGFCFHAQWVVLMKVSLLLLKQQQFPQFWPEKRRSSQKFGPVFTVTCKTSKHYTNIKTWEFSINKKVRCGFSLLQIELKWIETGGKYRDWNGSVDDVVLIYS